MGKQLTRDIPIEPSSSALLYIDIQNYFSSPEGGYFVKKSKDPDFEKSYSFYFNQLKKVTVPNMQKLQEACRKKKIEILYTTVESLTLDSRDFSLDYKITGFSVPKQSTDGKVIDELAPLENEICISKSSSSVFNSTNINYILRNLNVRQLIISGVLTDQCVESAVRDACDLGYLVTLATDSCTTFSQERHDSSLRTIAGYCRQLSTEKLINEINGAK